MKLLLSSLLIAGTTSLAVQETSAAITSSFNRFQSSATKDILESKTDKRGYDSQKNSIMLNYLGFNPNLVQQVASVLLPRWRSPWEGIGKERDLQSLNLDTKQKTEIKPSSSQNSSRLSSLPRISRSSLIVSPPGECASLVPSQCKDTDAVNSLLTHPAPATKTITNPFGWRIRPYSNQIQFHQGIDYSAPLGSPVVAAKDGIVIKVVSGCVDFGSLSCGSQFGNWIEIDHGNGAIAIYAHLQNHSITVREGMKVRKNQEIAKVGSSGWSTGAHLDFRLKIKGEYQNPADFVSVNSQQLTKD